MILGNARASLLVFGFAVLLLSPGWCQETTYSQKLYGNWYTYPRGNPNTDPVLRQFRHDKAASRDEIVVIRQCPLESRVVVAKAVSPIEVSEDTIRILRNDSDIQPTQGTSVCEASVSAGVYSYSFSEDDHLVLTNPGGNPDFLELAREDKTGGPAVPQKLYGTWLLPPFEGKTMRMQVRWVFYTTAERQDRLRQITVCNQGNDSLVAHIDTDINIGDDSLKVLQSASHQEQQGAFSCEARIEAATWRYSVAPGGMSVTLSGNGAKSIILTREPQSGLN
jgi:hypothetical protein